MDAISCTEWLHGASDGCQMAYLNYPIGSDIYIEQARASKVNFSANSASFDERK